MKEYMNEIDEYMIAYLGISKIGERESSPLSVKNEVLMTTEIKKKNRIRTNQEEKLEWRWVHPAGVLTLYTVHSTEVEVHCTEVVRYTFSTLPFLILELPAISA